MEDCVVVIPLAILLGINIPVALRSIARSVCSPRFFYYWQRIEKDDNWNISQYYYGILLKGQT